MKKKENTKGKIKIDNLLENITVLYIVLSTIVYLLVFPQNGYTDIPLLKYPMFLTINISYVVIMILVNIESILLGYNRNFKVYFSREYLLSSKAITSYIFVLYFLLTVVSGINSKYETFLGYSRKEGILTIFLYVAVMILIMINFKPKAWMLYVFGVSVTVFCFIGIVQLTGANIFNLFPKGYNFYDAGKYYGGQYWSTIGNTNLCSAFLSISMGTFVAALVRTDIKWRMCIIIPLFLSVFSVIELNAEAGLVAFIGGLLLILPFIIVDLKTLFKTIFVYGIIAISVGISMIVRFYDGGVSFNIGAKSIFVLLLGATIVGLSIMLDRIKFDRSISLKKIRGFAIGFVLIVVVVGIVFLYFSDGFSDGFLYQAHEILHGRIKDEFGSNRIFIWRNVWNLITEKPLLGGGPDTLGLRELPTFSRYNEEIGKTVYSSIDTAHNEYLNIIVNQGVLSFIPYMVGILYSMYLWWKQPESNLKAIAGCGTMFYCIQAFFGISQFISAIYLWIFLGILNSNNTHKAIS